MLFPHLYPYQATAYLTSAHPNETVDLNDSSSGFSGALTTSPPETGWARTKRQGLRLLKSVLPNWFPLTVIVPPPPSPPTNGTVTTLDLARL